MSKSIETSLSINNRLILEQYVPRAIEAKVSNGYASVAQKVTLAGLKLLVPGRLQDGTVIPAGSTAFIKETVLHVQPWAKDSFEADGIPGRFIIADLNLVDFIVPPKV